MRSTHMPLPSSPSLTTRVYGQFGGVDFTNVSTHVSLNRSPDAKNIYKNYRSANGQAIETRPGILILGKLSGTIHALHMLDDQCLIHHGTSLSVWESFPNRIEDAGDVTTFANCMADRESISFVFGTSLYLMDGTNYLVFRDTLQGFELNDVSDEAFIPTTSIGADPDGGYREEYQQINLLSPYRKNSFVSDGTSNVYFLDATGLDDVSGYTMQAWINGVEKTEDADFTVNRATGVVTFSTAPSGPATAGTDNVVIQFKRTVSSHLSRITECTTATTFDNRVFVSGNSDYPASLFHCELEDPSYFRETAYYTDGEDDSPVVDLIRGSGVLIVIKDEKGCGSKVFFHTPSLDTSFGKVYPMTETEVTQGAKGGGINFMDDILMLTPLGIEAIRLSSKSSDLDHRSTLIDRKFVSQIDMTRARMTVWENYLLISEGGNAYLADHRQIYRGENNAEYEWYYWDRIGAVDASELFQPATAFLADGKELYFGCADGRVCKFYGAVDNGGLSSDLLIDSYWTTPLDNFGTAANYKNIERHGGVVEVKYFPNSVVKVDVATDRESWFNVASKATQGFSFSMVDFANFTFGSGQRAKIIFNAKRRGVQDVSMKFYSDEVGKPFGVYAASLRASIQNYVKG